MMNSTRPALRNFSTFLFALTMLMGCGGHKSTASSTAAATATDPTLRLANATAAPALTMNGAGTTTTTITFASSAVPSGSVSDYISAAPQTYTVGVTANGGALIASTQGLSLSPGTNYTLLAYQRSGAVNTYTLFDSQIAPPAGFTSFAVANAAGDVGAVDVYLAAPNTPALNGIAPVFTNVLSKVTTVPKLFTADSYDVIVTAASNPLDVRLTLHSVALQSTGILTLALTSTIGGGLVDAALIQQGGTMQRIPATTARVRAVAAFPASGTTNATVTATVGGTTLPVLTAPSVGIYKLINGGSSTYDISVNGVAAANLPVATFANGGDYTILVYGSTTTPSVAVLTDNNQPSSSGAANMRLINGAVTSGGITLNDNYLPINIDVPFGTTSAYSPTTPLSTSLLQITSPVAAFPTYTATDVNIVGSGVYTIFVLGSTASPIVVFSKDR
jgi:hypothetical protein